MAKYQGQRMIKEDEYAYLQELIESHDDPSADWGSTYTAGDGIDITNNEISIDNTVALKSEIITSYNDLTDKPDLSIYAESSSLATVATTGDYDDLINKPTIPAAQVQSDWSQSDNTQVDFIKNKPTIPTVTSSITQGSTDAVTSGAVYNAIGDIETLLAAI